MSILSDLAQAAQQLAAAVRALATDPADAIRMLAGLAAAGGPASPSPDELGQAIATAGDATAALCRRAALAEMARAVPLAEPPSYEEAVALRDRVCGLLAAEEIRAADAGDDASAQALRDLRAAVDRDLTGRATNLASLRPVTAPAPLPALVHAYRLYEDLARADEISLRANAADPNFVGGGFLARSA